ncbi:hypothetical protein K7X08_033831 [Anisodus acutangulus]|uniref:Uncharacterized protein n=1 Tax=Anisodus acutangulus TaxID=402998 RepID=A0A9Q1RCE4_9SOLA|nr:hypothetical protein K7X08_033831 [Anisodus acutangulus]
MTPTNKSKGTKKKTSRKMKVLMDDVPLSEEGITTAPGDSELPEVDTTEEIVQKRKEEELALRFSEPGSKKLYLVGLEIKREGNLAWVIHEEKRMSWNGLKNECTGIIRKLKASRWDYFAKPTGLPRIDRIDRYMEPKQTVDYTRLEYVDQPVPTDASVPTSTSVLEILAPTTEAAPATSMATSSALVVGPDISAHGMRLIRLIEAKIMQLIDEFSAYVKEAIETALMPHKENLEVVREEQKSLRAHLQAIEL